MTNVCVGGVVDVDEVVGCVLNGMMNVEVSGVDEEGWGVVDGVCGGVVDVDGSVVVEDGVILER